MHRVEIDEIECPGARGKENRRRKPHHSFDHAPGHQLHPVAAGQLQELHRFAYTAFRDLDVDAVAEIVIDGPLGVFDGEYRFVQDEGYRAALFYVRKVLKRVPGEGLLEKLDGKAHLLQKIDKGEKGLCRIALIAVEAQAEAGDFFT